MKERVIYLLLLLNLFSVTVAHYEKHCLTDDQTSDIISRWTSIAIKIDLQVVNETVTDDFQFFSDSQDFLEGLPYGSANGVPSIANKTDLIQQQQVAQAPGTPTIPLSFTILHTLYSCREITFRWRFHAKYGGNLPGSTDQIGDPIEYSGIDILVLAVDSNLIQTAYSEWNNGELLYDLGTRTCFQKAPLVNENLCKPECNSSQMMVRRKVHYKPTLLRLAAETIQNEA